MKAFQEFIAKASAELIAESIKHGVSIGINTSFVNGSMALFINTPSKSVFTAEYRSEEDWYAALSLAKTSIQKTALEGIKVAA
ncbi:hypothetical protein [Vitreoscilla stercoraria]|uniref:Uncharacterized protein n=1 Tax=Vitreoscilla stercoraria TaxID=61 RepID=A0ABY4ED33_VITST|nr:hypothetical protein [Vitreoscilla stercoraria]UOO93362.1 hypothetical protein LVJ81_04865 [Vitreoscilla stercoraria]